jgi:hypothetical protein
MWRAVTIVAPSSGSASSNSHIVKIRANRSRAAVFGPINGASTMSSSIARQKRFSAVSPEARLALLRGARSLRCEDDRAPRCENRSPNARDRPPRRRADHHRSRLPSYGHRRYPAHTSCGPQTSRADLPLARQDSSPHRPPVLHTHPRRAIRIRHLKREVPQVADVLVRMAPVDRHRGWRQGVGSGGRHTSFRWVVQYRIVRASRPGQGCRSKPSLKPSRRADGIALSTAKR